MMAILKGTNLGDSLYGTSSGDTIYGYGGDMQKRISGYRSWFHRQMNYRTLVKT
jgi:hypothetical protein